jgi:gluconate 2-dehydrogenase gamma chain
MTHYDSSRRNFLQQSATVVGASWARVVLPGLAAISQAACTANEEKTPFAVLQPEEATEFEAIVARIIPTTDSPGAREAGVIHFLDQTFGTFNAGIFTPARGMLQQFQSGIEGGELFSELTEHDQDAYLESNEQTPFFGMMRFLTMCGFFGMNKYGGNQDDIGYKLVGMNSNARVYQSPFGYYDAEYQKENPNG